MFGIRTGSRVQCTNARFDIAGTAHRAHASTEGVTKYLSPSVSGFLLQKELDYLDGAVSDPKKPFAAIVGGSKVSTKITVIESLLEKAQKVCGSFLNVLDHLQGTCQLPVFLPFSRS